MTNIVHEVWKALDDNPCIRRNMNLGIINTRALAKYLIIEQKLDTTIDAVTSAIRRYQQSKHDKIFDNSLKIIKKTINISTRSGLTEIYLCKDDEIQRLLPKMFDLIQYVRGDVLRIIQANESIRLLIDEKNLEKFKKFFPREKIIHIDINLAEINIYIHPDTQQTPGILAIISSELAIQGINIAEAMTCPPELLFFVREEDLLKAYQVLYQLCKPTKRMK